MVRQGRQMNKIDIPNLSINFWFWEYFRIRKFIFIPLDGEGAVQHQVMVWRIKKKHSVALVKLEDFNITLRYLGCLKIKANRSTSTPRKAIGIRWTCTANIIRRVIIGEMESSVDMICLVCRTFPNLKLFQIVDSSYCYFCVLSRKWLIS